MGHCPARLEEGEVTLEQIAEALQGGPCPDQEVRLLGPGPSRAAGP